MKSSKTPNKTFSNSNHVSYRGTNNASTQNTPKMTTGSRGPTVGNTTGKTAGYPTAHSYAHGTGGTVGARSGMKLMTPTGSQGAPCCNSADVNCALDQPVKVNHGKK